MDLRPLLRSGPPTALVLTGDWRAVVDLQGRLHQAHPDTTFVHLRGGKMRTAAGFFDELAAALQFPSWFGENWDALTDIARFRGWFAGIVLGVYDAHDLLARWQAAGLSIATLPADAARRLSGRRCGARPGAPGCR